jgi:ABC-2 type transport system permease protein
MIAEIAWVTVRALLTRRRALLMVLLAAVPVLFAVVARVWGDLDEPVEQAAGTIDAVIVATLLPLLALVFGTAALGAELEDGSAIHLLTKPVARWRIMAAKTLAAAPITVGLAAGSALLTGLLMTGQDGAGMTLAFVVGIAIGGVLYTTLFVTLSVLTGRALLLGLAYVVIWEGMLAGLFEGTRVLSVRQYVLSIVAALDPSGAVDVSSTLEPLAAVTGSVVVFVVAFMVGVRALQRHQVTAGD